MGGLLDHYVRVQPSDLSMFAGVDEAVSDRVRGTASARRTPAQLSAEFTRLAEAAEAALQTAIEVAEPVDDTAARELRGVALDVRVQVQLARYHAAKLRAAAGLAAFYATGDLDSFARARPAAQETLAAWRRLVALTDGVYHHDLVFSLRDEQSGHWRDQLPYVLFDAERVEETQALFDRFSLFDYV
jgi:hypothetical protein